MDERIWLKHKETDGFFHAPAEAADTFAALGWEPTDERPPEPNAAVAERIAYEQQLATKAAEEAKEEAKPRKRAAHKTEPAEEPAEETSDTPRRGTTDEEG